MILDMQTQRWYDINLDVAGANVAFSNSFLRQSIPVLSITASRDIFTNVLSVDGTGGEIQPRSEG